MSCNMSVADNFIMAEMKETTFCIHYRTWKNLIYNHLNQTWKLKKLVKKRKNNKKTETKNKRKIIKTLMKWFLITMQIIFTDKYFCFIRWRNVNFVMVVVPRICRPLQPIKFLTFLSQSVNSPEISAEPFIQPNGVDFSFSFPCFAFCDN